MDMLYGSLLYRSNSIVYFYNITVINYYTYTYINSIIMYLHAYIAVNRVQPTLNMIEYQHTSYNINY